MSFYIIEDDDGKLLTDYGDFDNTMIHARLYDEPLEPERCADEYGGHVVELVEKPTPVVASQEEADMLEKAKHNPTLRPSFMITEYSNSHKGNILGNDLEDRLMRAYVLGWTVEKPKLYVVFVPHTNRRIVYAKGIDGIDTMDVAFGNIPEGRFTQSEIDDNDLGGCEKTEVKQDGE